MRSYTLVMLLMAAFSAAAVPASWSDEPVAPSGSESAQSVAAGPESSAAAESVTLLAFGIDNYYGSSNMSGLRRYSDGMWAGSCTPYPSSTYMQWNSPRGEVGRLAIGTGELSTDESSTLRQPLEGYWQTPCGAATLTFGKYWVPFAQQEWTYETRWGAMAEWAGERSSFSASLNYNRYTLKPNLYLRLGHKVGSDAEFGVSLGRGSGFSAGSIHDRGFALDANIGCRGWRLYSEYNAYSAGSPGKFFNFVSGKLYYENLGKLVPFVARFCWDDNSGEFGTFRSWVIGADYQVTPWLAVQAAASDTSDGSVSWLQVHLTREFSLIGH